MATRRALLLGLAALLSALALLAIAILLVGHFRETERRIFATTVLLAAFALLASPAAVLLERHRLPALAAANLLAVAIAATLMLVSVWTRNPSDTFGKAIGTATLCALAVAQAAALCARRSSADPPVVPRLLPAAIGTGTVAATASIVLIWSQPDNGAWGRAVAALVVLDVLLVALQPLLARITPAASARR